MPKATRNIAPINAKLTRLRDIGRAAGPQWLATVAAATGIERISNLPESAVDRLLAVFERAAPLEAA